jgi:hypothetical protein
MSTLKMPTEFLATPGEDLAERMGFEFLLLSNSSRASHLLPNRFFRQDFKVFYQFP